MGENYLNLFLSQIEIKGSKKTATDYKNNIQKFIDTIRKPIENVNYQDLVEYYLCFDNLKVNSKRTYMAAIISYFKFLYEQGKISEDITKAFKMPKAEIKDMDYLDSNEALYASKICEGESRHSLRKKAMLITLINTGMRSSELSNLKIDDLKDGWIIIRNAKRNKFRRIPLHPSVEKAINDYIKNERKSDSEYLFVNQYGNKLTNTNINRDLARITKKADIDKHISAHRLRDTFATIQYINGSDIKSIQETLGHDNIQMTLHYVQKVDEKRREQILHSGINF